MYPRIPFPMLDDASLRRFCTLSANCARQTMHSILAVFAVASSSIFPSSRSTRSNRSESNEYSCADPHLSHRQENSACGVFFHSKSNSDPTNPPWDTRKTLRFHRLW